MTTFTVDQASPSLDPVWMEGYYDGHREGYYNISHTVNPFLEGTTHHDRWKIGNVNGFFDGKRDRVAQSTRVEQS